MNAVLLVIFSLLALVIALLTIPLSLSFSMTSIQTLQGQADFHWLFGLVNFKTRFPGEKISIEDRQKAPPARFRQEKQNRHSRAIFVFFKQPVFRQHVMKFIGNLIRIAHAQNLYLRLRIGLGDPADTGMLWAAMGPLSGMMKNLRGLTIDIEPEFIDAILEFEGRGHLTLIPIQFIALTIAFILSPKTIRFWRATSRVNP